LIGNIIFLLISVGYIILFKVQENVSNKLTQVVPYDELALNFVDANERIVTTRPIVNRMKP